MTLTNAGMSAQRNSLAAGSSLGLYLPMCCLVGTTSREGGHVVLAREGSHSMSVGGDAEAAAPAPALSASASASRTLRRSRSLRFWVTAGIAVLVVAILGSAAGTMSQRRRVDAAASMQRDVLRPAATAADMLTAAYINQETGERGFLLTGDPVFLQPYLSGRRAATQATDALLTLLRGDDHGQSLLHAVITAGSRWQSDSAAPDIQVQRNGAVPAGPTHRLALRGKALFDVLRSRLAALSRHISTRLAAQTTEFQRAQSAAQLRTLLALALALGAAALCVVLLWQMLTRPLNRLIRSVESVFTGAYTETIDGRGPQEVALLAAAVDRMRTRIVDSSRELVTAQRLLSVSEERDRIAADLHDLTIQRVYGLGLCMLTLLRSHPQLAADLQPLIDDTDEVVRELRGVILQIGRDTNTADLPTRIRRLVTDSERPLGFAVQLKMDGPIEVADATPQAEAMLAVLREGLSNVARHAHASAVHVTIAVDLRSNNEPGPATSEGMDQATLRLLVTDDGIGSATAARAGNGLRNLHERARKFGGRATVHTGDSGGTAVSWHAPIQFAQGWPFHDPVTITLSAPALNHPPRDHAPRDRDKVTASRNCANRPQGPAKTSTRP